MLAHINHFYYNAEPRKCLVVCRGEGLRSGVWEEEEQLGQASVQERKVDAREVAGPHLDNIKCFLLFCCCFFKSFSFQCGG